MCQPCFPRPVVSVHCAGLCSHSVSWIHRKRGCWTHFLLIVQRICEVRFQNFARNINFRLSLRATPPSFTFSVSSISWWSQKPRRFITHACFPLHNLPSRIPHQGSSSHKSARTPARFMAPHGGGPVGGVLLQWVPVVNGGFSSTLHLCHHPSVNYAWVGKEKQQRFLVLSCLFLLTW